ncbi:hypothetical protein PIB30_081909 [Stylosanthes scabra]|uniref:Uncharacterized protein n=1 Tax=Stylosanthes scabra TaxID=79078 RepID=A0ABU6UR82_9FABA|nr:hypothetical protein [Stylosanthes scabra]
MFIAPNNKKISKHHGLRVHINTRTKVVVALTFMHLHGWWFMVLARARTFLEQQESRNHKHPKLINLRSVDDEGSFASPQTVRQSELQCGSYGHWKATMNSVRVDSKATLNQF